MELGEKAILRDCLDTLKHASLCYLRASLEADSDGLRKTFDRLALDESEEKNAVFNLMHQAGIYETFPADPRQLAALRRACGRFLDRIGREEATERERGAPAGHSARS